jgi:arabinogalactan endo-1,4-beta-galactosidase
MVKQKVDSLFSARKNSADKSDTWIRKEFHDNQEKIYKQTVEEVLKSLEQSGIVYGIFR